MPRNTASEINAEEYQRPKTDSLSDPFALDFFAQSTVEIVEPDEVVTIVSPENAVAQPQPEIFTRTWQQDLPRISISDVSRGNVFSQIPDDFAKIVLSVAAESLAQRLMNNQAAICEIVSAEESNSVIEAETLSGEQFVFLNFSVEPNQVNGVLALNPVFAVKAIKKGFGYEVGEEEKRQLSKNELAVIEFFALGCLSDLNKSVARPLFRLQNVEQTVPKWLHTKDSNKNRHGLTVKIVVQLDDVADVARLFLPYELIKSLSETDNLLLKKRKNTNLSKIVSSVRLRIGIGETDLDSGELAVLEAGDVILLERPTVNLHDKALSGNVSLLIGGECQPSLSGDLSTFENLIFEIREINQNNEQSQPDRLRMSELQNTDQTTESNDFDQNGEADGNSLALEKVLVTLRAEIAARRISLDELAALRVNQIIELGARASDPIELTVDGKTVAIGELVNIEDSLGVRLTRVLV